MTWEFDVKEQVDNIVDWIKTYFVHNGPDSKAVIGISGGKDSSVAAALLVRALGKERVIGVKMPQGEQSDIDCANKLITHLDIPNVEVNIGSAVESLLDGLYEGGVDTKNSQLLTNTPARIRMTTLYAVAAAVGGRVANTCNYSEDYVGYATKFGDGAGDFSILSQYTVREILLIGDYLGLPYELVHKTPIDGLCGKSDEDNLGFTYETLDRYLLEGIKPDCEIYKKIEQMHSRNLHKLRYMPSCTKKLKGRVEF